MKPKKAKQQRLNIHTEFDITDEDCAALSHALAFVGLLEDFSYVDEKISYDSALHAEDKLFCNTKELSRGEVNATARAIDVVLLRLPGHVSDFSYMEDEIPNLLTDLEKELPLLQALQPIFHNAVTFLKKHK